MRPDRRVIIKYTLLQVPMAVFIVVVMILAHRWFSIPVWICWMIVIGWVIKDIVLFPFVWRSYSVQRGESPFSMTGEKGIAEERLDPSGRIRIRGELWQGRVLEGTSPVERGQSVRVCEIRGLTLIVKPDNDSTTE